MKQLRYDPAFPKGANVNFYQILGENEVRVLTYERGVENFTLACGTGTGSVACVMRLLGQLTGDTLTAHNRGGTLKITLSGDPIDTIFLEGPTEVVRLYEI
jgi:diaminopimelate epimerase